MDVTPTGGVHQSRARSTSWGSGRYRQHEAHVEHGCVQRARIARAGLVRSELRFPDCRRRETKGTGDRRRAGCASPT